MLSRAQRVGLHNDWSWLACLDGLVIWRLGTRVTSVYTHLIHRGVAMAYGRDGRPPSTCRPGDYGVYTESEGRARRSPLPALIFPDSWAKRNGDDVQPPASIATLQSMVTTDRLRTLLQSSGRSAGDRRLVPQIAVSRQRAGTDRDRMDRLWISVLRLIIVADKEEEKQEDGIHGSNLVSNLVPVSPPVADSQARDQVTFRPAPRVPWAESMLARTLLGEGPR
ncbi:hypothetical protein BO71DRAFT_207542 [Aspergillus ellipticus CBS 707.79]|uniref:Uncharacterized protein n=1 Tax=Aspergillus ellipticus CBS 707.79 TaxID=1448320 RepID=A0A319DPK5_9EURO|nr:hypothetical protein BO71DRAFT_207542 [Aspergillus ellipticus CBS 707.79]